jgi:hypothetical protein
MIVVERVKSHEDRVRCDFSGVRPCAMPCLVKGLAECTEALSAALYCTSVYSFPYSNLLSLPSILALSKDNCVGKKVRTQLAGPDCVPSGSIFTACNPFDLPLLISLLCSYPRSPNNPSISDIQTQARSSIFGEHVGWAFRVCCPVCAPVERLLCHCRPSPNFSVSLLVSSVTQILISVISRLG